MRMVESETEALLADSTAISSDLGIGYGGVDEDGKMEASSRHRNCWEE